MEAGGWAAGASAGEAAAGGVGGGRGGGPGAAAASRGHAARQRNPLASVAPGHRSVCTPHITNLEADAGVSASASGVAARSRTAAARGAQNSKPLMRCRLLRTSWHARRTAEARLGMAFGMRRRGTRRRSPAAQRPGRRATAERGRPEVPFRSRRHLRPLRSAAAESRHIPRRGLSYMVEQRTSSAAHTLVRTRCARTTCACVTVWWRPDCGGPRASGRGAVPPAAQRCGGEPLHQQHARPSGAPGLGCAPGAGRRSTGGGGPRDIRPRDRAGEQAELLSPQSPCPLRQQLPSFLGQPCTD